MMRYRDGGVPGEQLTMQTSLPDGVYGYVPHTG